MVPSSLHFKIAQIPGCHASVTPVAENGNVRFFRYRAVFDAPGTSAAPVASCELPDGESCGYWSPEPGEPHSIRPVWDERGLWSRFTSYPPVCAVTRYDGSAYVTISHSDVAYPAGILVGRNEESGRISISFRFLDHIIEPLTEYEALIRLDFSGKPLCDAVADATAWMEQTLGCTPAPVPDLAREPMYSTWYAFHHALDADALLSECERAAALGMKTILIDDGWQTRCGYPNCGDWIPDRAKIPDMRALVARIHAAGMKVMLWFALPFAGPGSDIYSRFADRSLRRSFDTVSCMDVRYPDVRDYLLSVLERAVRDWDLDGLKLDFLDEWHIGEQTQPKNERMDFATVEDALTCFFSSVYRVCTAYKADFLFEFRQSYTGPAMRRFGNMLRVTDCACDALRNRYGILDLRMTSGATAVHSDMILWRADDPPVSVAEQLTAALFGVPQISVRLDSLPEEQTQVLRHWLGFAVSHRELLQSGHLRITNPELDGTQVISEHGTERITVNYAPLPFDLNDAEVQYLINATSVSAVVLRGGDGRRFDLCVSDCAGSTVLQETRTLAHLEDLRVPPCGLVTLRLSL